MSAAATTTPLRTCIGCRRGAPSDALVHLTVRGERVEVADPIVAGRTGRGAWLCPQETCFEAALRRRAFDRAFRRRVSIDDDLRRRFTSACAQRKAVR